MQVKNLTVQKIREGHGGYGYDYAADIKIVCSEAQNDPNNFAKANYILTNWMKYPNTILYKLLKEGQLDNDNGIFTLLYDENKLIAFGGAYKHDKETLIALWRTYVTKEYRSKVLLGNYILPKQIEYAKSNGFKKVWLTFNEYNTYLYNAFKRVSKSKALILGSKTPEIYNNMYFHTKEKIIRETSQKIIEIRLLHHPTHN